MSLRRILFSWMLLSCSLWYCTVRVVAQEQAQSRDNNFFEVAYGGGTPLRTTSTMREMMRQAYASTFQVTFAHQYDKEDFGTLPHNRFYPSVGLTVAYSDFSDIKMVPKGHDAEAGRTSSFGRFIALAVSFSQYAHCDGPFRIKTIIENGAAYALDPFDAVDNPYSSIGGHFQVYFNFGVFACYAFRENELSLGPQFTHYSNSGTHRPNRGVNNIALALRFKHADLDAVQRGGRMPRRERYPSYFYWAVNVNGGIHTYKESVKLYELEHPDDPRSDDHCPTYGDLNVSADFMCRINEVHGAGLGLDFFYADGYETLKQYYEAAHSQAARRIKRTYWGLAIKHESYIRNFAINVHVGTYLGTQHLKGAGTFTHIYERIGLKYYWGKGDIRPYCGYFIKGNLFTAEQFEFCLGLSFHKYRKG